MVDTVTIFSHQDHSQTQQAINALNDQHVHSNTYTGESWYTGRQGNLRVMVNDNGVSVNGSLAKYYLGCNAETLTRESIKQSFEKLSDELHIPMHDALVYRLDIGVNFIVREPIITYLSQLGNKQYFDRGGIKKEKGLLYTSGRNALSFYDKIADLQRHKEEIPLIFQGHNVLRYERRWSGRIAKQFSCISITGSMLYEEIFYRRFVEKWWQDFISIHKRQLPTNEVSMNGTKEFVNSLALLQIQLMGEDYLMENIKAQQRSGAIGKKTASDLRRKLKEITQSKVSGLQSNDVIHELEAKVSQAAQNYM